MKYLTNRMGGLKDSAAFFIAIIFCCCSRSFKIFFLMASSLSWYGCLSELTKYLQVLFHYHMENHSLLSVWTGKEVVDGYCIPATSQKHLDSDTTASSNPC